MSNIVFRKGVGAGRGMFVMQLNGPAAWGAPGGANLATLSTGKGDLRLSASASDAAGGGITVQAGTGRIGVGKSQPSAALDVSGGVCATSYVDGSGFPMLSGATALWTAYSPTFAQDDGTGGLSVGGGGGALVGRYFWFGTMVTVEIGMTLGSGTTLGSASRAWAWTLPVAPAAGATAYGTALLRDASTGGAYSGIAASLMMVVPVVVTAINHHLTMVGSFGALRSSPTLRFVVFGAVNYTLVSFTGSAMAIRSVNEITHFTHFTVGHAHQGMYAFFTMVMFGAVYYILPRILLKEWPSAALIRTHFWAAAIGVTLYWVDLEIGGWIQGMEMNNANIAFLDVVRHTIPWLFVRSVAGIVMTIGHLAFAVNIAWMLCARRPAGATTPTLFHNPPAMRAASAR